MNNTKKDLIYRWYKKSQQEDKNIFDRFISLWISFNAYYSRNNLKLSEHEQLDLFQNANKVIFSSVVKADNVEFLKFKEYIATKNQNAGFIQNLRYEVGDEKNKKRYQNLESLNEYLGCVYQIRCNLFHGGKDVADTQDETLVELALSTLSILLKRVFEKENILSL